VKLLIFFGLALVVHGPLSPVLPTAFEATLLYYAHLYPAWLLALVGTAGASLAEVVNYRLLDWAAELPKLAALKTRKSVRWSIAAFLRAPFWTTVVVIFSPIPDTAVRVLAPLGKYPLPKFLAAIALGRFPRLLLIAGSGALLGIPTPLLLAASGVIVAAGVGCRCLKRAA
jgi:membrane protein YqaA with SNARE-associated domain